jgi:predicted transposase/invertase (TIGR01784 family)
MDRRSLFYWSREYSKSLSAGQDYRELPNVVAVNIVDFEFMPSKDFHTTFHLWEDREKDLMLTEALEIHFVDMVKFRALREKDIKNDPLHRWLAWLNPDSPAELVREVVNMDDAIRRADEQISYVLQDKEALRAYEMRQMALSDLTSAVNYAREEGIKEGKEEGQKEGIKEGLQAGMEKGRMEMARKMKAIGIPVKQIAAVSGLSPEQIKGL